MLRSLTILFVFQFAGEVVSFGLRAPVPGPVFGMVFLFLYLLLREGEAALLRATVQELLRHLSLLFVPAGVGVMLYVDTVRKEWLPITVSLVCSTALAIVVTAITARAVHRRMNRANPDAAELHDEDDEEKQ